jgi:hypothetical protein
VDGAAGARCERTDASAVPSANACAQDERCRRDGEEPNGEPQLVGPQQIDLLATDRAVALERPERLTKGAQLGGCARQVSGVERDAAGHCGERGFEDEVLRLGSVGPS